MKERSGAEQRQYFSHLVLPSFTLQGLGDCERVWGRGSWGGGEGGQAMKKNRTSLCVRACTRVRVCVM